MKSEIRNGNHFAEIYEVGDEVEVFPAWKTAAVAPSSLVHCTEVYERSAGRDLRILVVDDAPLKGVVWKHLPYNPAQGFPEDVYVVNILDEVDGKVDRLVEIRALYFRPRSSLRE